MSLDDSTAPETASATADGSGGAGRSAKTFVLGGLALALVVGLVGFFTVRGASGEPEGADCISEVVTLTTAPVMEDLVKPGGQGRQRGRALHRHPGHRGHREGRRRRC